MLTLSIRMKKRLAFFFVARNMNLVMDALGFASPLSFCGRRVVDVVALSLCITNVLTITLM